MIVDTNVLLRALDGGKTPHSRAAHKRIRAARASEEKLAVMSSTVLEAAYVLESEGTGYGWDRDAVAEAIGAVVDEPGFAVEHGTALRAAATTYRQRSIDLHDCFLSALAEERGTRVLSFDADLRRLGTGQRP